MSESVRTQGEPERGEGAENPVAPRGRTLRKVAVAVAVIVAVLAVAALVVLSRLDGMVERALEDQGTAILGSEVVVEDVDLSAISGDGSVRGLKVRNVEGFSEPWFLDIDTVGVKLDPWSVLAGTGSPVHVREIEIQSADVHVEARLRATNITTLRRRLRGARAEREALAISKRRMIVDRLALRGTKVHLHFGGAGRSANRAIALPDLELRDLGGERGEVPHVLVREVMERVADQAWAAARRAADPWRRLSDVLRRGGREGVDRAGPALKLGADALREAAGGILDQWRRRAQDAAKKQGGGAKRAE